MIFYCLASSDLTSWRCVFHAHFQRCSAKWRDSALVRQRPSVFTFNVMGSNFVELAGKLWQPCFGLQGHYMIKGEEIGSGAKPRKKASRPRRIVSPKGRRYLSLCELVDRTQEELTAFIKTNHPDEWSGFDHFIRKGTSPTNEVRDAMIAFLADTWIPIGRTWFDFSWHHFSVFDLFVSSNRKYAGVSKDFCGEFMRVFPVSSNSRSADELPKLTARSLKIWPGGNDGEGVLRWTQPHTGNTDKTTEGFGFHGPHNAFLLGINTDDKSTVTYAVLRTPPKFLRDLGVRLFGLQAGTILFGPLTGHGVAKRTMLVETSVWNEWNASALCPEEVRSWLLSNGHELMVDLEAKGTGNDE